MSAPGIDEATLEAQLEKLRKIARSPWNEAVEAKLRSELVPAFLEAKRQLEEIAVQAAMLQSSIPDRVRDQVENSYEGLAYRVAEARAKENPVFSAASFAKLMEVVHAQQIEDGAAKAEALRRAEERFVEEVGELPEYQLLQQCAVARKEVIDRAIADIRSELDPIVAELKAAQKRLVAALEAMCTTADVEIRRAQPKRTPKPPVVDDPGVDL